MKVLSCRTVRTIISLYMTVAFSLGIFICTGHHIHEPDHSHETFVGIHHIHNGSCHHSLPQIKQQETHCYSLECCPESHEHLKSNSILNSRIHLSIQKTINEKISIIPYHLNLLESSHSMIYRKFEPLFKFLLLSVRTIVLLN